MTQNLEPWLTQRWQKGSRYYVAEIIQDLFGTWLVKRSWGSIDTHRGNHMTLVAGDYQQALQLLQAVEKRRKGRGYQPA